MLGRNAGVGTRAVIPKLCAAAHLCAATDSQVCREAFWNFGKELYVY